MLSLLVGSAFLHALWNAQLKRMRNRQRSLRIVIGVAVITSALVAGLQGTFRISWTPWVLASGLGEALYIAMLGRVYDTMPLGLGYLQVRSLAMIGTYALSVSFLAEPLTPVAIGAVCLIGVGMWFSDGARRIGTPPNRWVWGASAGVVGYHLGYGQALAEGQDPASLIAVSLAMAWLFQIRPKGPRLSSSEIRGSMFAGVICALSFIGFLYGLRYTHAGIAISVRNSSVVFAQLLALRAGEKLTPLRWVGVTVVFVGVLLLGLRP